MRLIASGLYEVNIEARGNDDAHARAEKEVLDFREFAGRQMLEGALLTGDANVSSAPSSICHRRGGPSHMDRC